MTTEHIGAMVRLEAALINSCEGYRPKPKDNIIYSKNNTQPAPAPGGRAGRSGPGYDR